MQAATDLKALIDQYLEIFKTYSEAEWAAKPQPGKWSKKEILGHLIDSALTNLRRFIVTQYLENQQIVYYQDEWVTLQHYQSAYTPELIDLWQLLNRQIARVMENTPVERLKNTCDTGKNAPELHPLNWLMADYTVHAAHHLQQIADGEKFVP